MYKTTKEIGDIPMLPEERELAIHLHKHARYEDLIPVLYYWYKRPNGEGYTAWGFVERKAKACGIPDVSSTIDKWIDKGRGIAQNIYHVGYRYSVKEKGLRCPDWEKLFAEANIKIKT